MLQLAGFKAFAELLGGRAHESVAADPIAAARHRMFIAAHLVVGVAPFAALPASLALGNAPTGAGLAAFAWLLAPILIAFGLARSGDLEAACLRSAIAFAALTALVAGGGAGWLALPWLALPLIEAALSGSRRASTGAALVIAVAALALAGLSIAGGPQPFGSDVTVGIVGCLAAGAYAISLAARTGMLIAEERSANAGRALFERFASASNDLVTRHGADGSVAFASHAAVDLLGVAPRKLLDQGLSARVHLSDRPGMLVALGAAAAGETPAPVELRVQRGDDERDGRRDFAWVEMRARRVRPHEADADDADAAPVVATFREIADRKAHEAALVAAHEEADRASVAKTRFLANMSHELRTPLNAIIGFSEILSDEELCGVAPERRADYAALIHKSGAHLLEVVNSILDMAKIESGSFSILPEPCEVGPIVKQCAALMTLTAETAGLTLSAEVSPDTPIVCADRRALTQILLNLVANAIKFTPRGGSVSIEVKPATGGVVLSVRDTGVGIAADDLARVYDAFFQVDGGCGRRHEGSGLGLSVVRGLVALHQGEISIESALGCGARVAVFLPLDRRGASASNALAPSGAAATPQLPVEKVRRSA